MLWAFCHNKVTSTGDASFISQQLLSSFLSSEPSSSVKRQGELHLLLYFSSIYKLKKKKLYTLNLDR